MFIIQLKFSENRSAVKEHMDGHKQWLQAGFDDGIFLLAGSLQPNLGGGIVAHYVTKDEIETRVAQDPFVVHDVVKAEIIELTPSKACEQLSFLLE